MEGKRNKKIVQQKVSNVRQFREDPSEDLYGAAAAAGSSCWGREKPAGDSWLMKEKSAVCE